MEQLPKRIGIPSGWTPEQDLECFVERWGDPSGDYATAVFDKITENYRDLSNMAEAALRFLFSKNPQIVAVNPSTLELREKLEMMIEIGKQNPRWPEYRKWLLQGVNNCRWVDAERARILSEYRLPGGNVWLYPRVMLADYLAWAAWEIEEAIANVHDDFKAP